MEHITFLEKRVGSSLVCQESNLRPINYKSCVGKSTLQRMLEIAYKMDDKPNIIIKEGFSGKWHLIRSPKDLINESIEKQKIWIDISQSTIWIIDWDL